MVLAGVLGLGFAACSSSVDSKTPENNGKAIQFNVTVPKATRDVVTNTTSLKTFAVWSFVDKKPFMQYVEVTRTESITWTYSPMPFP